MKYQREYTGKITRREAVAIAEQILHAAGVPQSTYGLQKNGLVIVVGGRLHEIEIRPGMTYFAMQRLVAHCEQVVREYVAAKNQRNQIDIEDAIREAQNSKENSIGI